MDAVAVVRRNAHNVHIPKSILRAFLTVCFCVCFFVVVVDTEGKTLNGKLFKCLIFALFFPSSKCHLSRHYALLHTNQDQVTTETRVC